MKSVLAFLFAWWDTPLYLWSVKTFIGFICLICIFLLPFALADVIKEEINIYKEKKKIEIETQDLKEQLERVKDKLNKK